MIFFLLVGCASRPTPQNQTPPLVIFFVNGVRLSEAAADSIWRGIDSGRETDSVRVLKGSRALAEYDAEGRPGVVLIYLREGQNKEAVVLR